MEQFLFPLFLERFDIGSHGGQQFAAFRIVLRFLFQEGRQLAVQRGVDVDFVGVIEERIEFVELSLV